MRTVLRSSTSLVAERVPVTVLQSRLALPKHSLTVVPSYGSQRISRTWVAIHNSFEAVRCLYSITAKIMEGRAGVINMHLAVDVSAADALTMLYKISEGYVQEAHYGLALAKMVDLPPLILSIAEKVSTALEEQAAVKKRSSKASALAKRRKLVLSLRESLMQARDGPMSGRVLGSWLRRMQEEFVSRMEAIEGEVGENVVEGVDEEEHMYSLED